MRALTLSSARPASPWARHSRDQRRYIEELAGSDVDDLSGEVVVISTDTHHQHLVEAQGADLPIHSFVGFEQRSSGT